MRRLDRRCFRNLWNTCQQPGGVKLCSRESPFSFKVVILLVLLPEICSLVSVGYSNLICTLDFVRQSQKLFWAAIQVEQDVSLSLYANEFGIPL